MSAFTVVVWNMGLGSPPRKNASWNWRRLIGLMGEHSAGLALLNEASVTVPNDVDALIEPTGTKGRDLRRDGRPVSRRWATAIVSSRGRPESFAARARGRYGRRPNIPFEPSRPGSWVAGLVDGGSLGRITSVALYGLLEELSDASVHRSLSDVSPIFTDPNYNRLVLVGGDLNTSTQWKKGEDRARDEGVLRRFETYGLVDCLRQAHVEERLANCPCVFGDECRHTWTRRDPRRPAVGYQMDYLFASKALAKRLKTCVALPPPEWAQYSDHSPIIATFK